MTSSSGFARSPWEQGYTPVKFPPSELNLPTETRFFSAGSCFARELSQYLEDHFLLHRFSPQGISYNPLSLAQGLNLLGEPSLLENDQYMVKQGDLWKHYLLHGERSEKDGKSLTDRVIEEFRQSDSWLGDTPLLVLTLGTSWVFKLKENGDIVNNCHKSPSHLFTRENISINEMKQSLTHSIKKLKSRHHNLRIVLTVSPVRHLRDDPRENSLSKSRLICTAQELAQEHGHIHYFPSYEIMMDELRDYRWYNRDLKHPSPQAAIYIMERFIKWAGSDKLKNWIKEAKKLKGRLNHRPLNMGAEYERFQRETDNILKDRIQSYPHFKEIWDEKHGAI